MTMFERTAKPSIAPLVRTRCLTWTFVLCAAASGLAAQTNLDFNGSFEFNPLKSDVPDGWSAAGNRAVKQQLVFDTVRDGQRCARLECTGFAGDGPDDHAMICQVGRVGARRGQRYRLAF